MTDLNILAWTLAERLQNDLLSEEIALDDPRELELFEAVIREAIEKTLTDAERAIEMIPVDHFKDIYAYIGRSDACRVIAELRESLKQSNSGRAEQGIVREN